jgi:hypothetical protein
MTTAGPSRDASGERGAALFLAAIAMAMLSTMIVAFALVGRTETFISQTGRDEIQAAFAAEAGSNHGRWLLAQRLRRDLPRSVAATGRAAMATAIQGTYNTPAGAAQLIVNLAVPAVSGPSFVLCTAVTGGCPEPTFSAVGAIPDTQQAIMLLDSTNGAALPYTTRVIVGSHPAQPPAITNGGTSALYTYVWRIESSGTSGRALQQFVIHDSAVPTNTAGSFTIALTSSFVQYAHFIDNMTSNDAWISFRHVYTGPVHTNNRFNILGNPVGPTFRSAATQTQSTVRFNNAGSTTTTAADSTAHDQPLLGDAPGILCQVNDCAGFTRSFDYDPQTPAIDPIPFPSAGSADRTAQRNAARGPNYPSIICTAGPCPTIVSHDAGGNVNGGIFVNSRVTDLALGATGTGQQIVIETPAVANSRRRTVITENRAAGQMTVRRECFGPSAGSADTAGCGAPRARWNLDTTITPAANRQQTLTGLLSPTAVTDNGVLFVESTCINNGCGTGVGAIGNRDGDGCQAGSLCGLRKDPSTAVTRALDRDTRLTIGTDGDVYVTGNLTYQVDPRGADGVFSSPIPGEPVATTDDLLGVQNVLGVVAWDGGLHLQEDLSQANINNTLPAGDAHRDGNLRVQGMFMTPNISGGTSSGEGEFSFDDPNGAYRGQAVLLGGVIQKTMGTLGSPGTPGTGYARNWVYDERFRYRGLAPPNFPGFPSFTAATSLGIDSYSWRMGRF